MCKKEWVWGQRKICFYTFVWGSCYVFILPFPLNTFDCMKKTTLLACFKEKSHFNYVSSNGFLKWACTQTPDRVSLTMLLWEGGGDPIPRYPICLAPLLRQQTKNWYLSNICSFSVIMNSINTALSLMMATALPLAYLQVKSGSMWVSSLQTSHPVSSGKNQMLFTSTAHGL